MLLAVENSVKLEQFYELDNQVNKCVTQDALRELRADINDKVNRHEIDIITAENEEIMRQFSNITSK